MGSVNRAIIVGNLGRDAEVRYTNDGKAVANFTVATTESWKDANGNRNERTEWHRVNLWGKTAEVLGQYLVKGKQVYVEGRIQTREYEKDGVKKFSTEIRADNIVLLGGGDRDRSARASSSGASDFDDDLPI